MRSLCTLIKVISNAQLCNLKQKKLDLAAYGASNMTKMDRSSIYSLELKITQSWLLKLNLIVCEQNQIIQKYLCTNTCGAHLNLGTKKIAALCSILDVTSMDVSLRPLCCTCRRLHAG